MEERNEDPSRSGDDLKVPRTDVEELKIGQESLKEGFAELKIGQESLIEGFAELKTGQESLKEDVDTLKVDVEVLKGDVEVLKSDVKELKSGQEKLTDSFASLEDRMEKRFDQQNDTLAFILQSLNSYLEDSRRHNEVLLEQHRSEIQALGEGTGSSRLEDHEFRIERLEEAVFPPS